MIHRDGKDILTQRQYMLFIQHRIQMIPVDFWAKALRIHDDVQHLPDAHAAMQKMLDKMHDEKQHMLRMRKRIHITAHDPVHRRMRKGIRKKLLIRAICLRLLREQRRMQLDRKSARWIQQRRHLRAAVSDLKTILHHDLLGPRTIFLAHIQILIIRRPVIWFRIQRTTDDALEHEHPQVSLQETLIQPHETIALDRLDRIDPDRVLFPLRLQIIRKARKSADLFIQKRKYLMLQPKHKQLGEINFSRFRTQPQPRIPQQTQKLFHRVLHFRQFFRLIYFIILQILYNQDTAFSLPGSVYHVI